MTRPARHWLFAVNAAVGAFVGGAILAPLLAMLGWLAPAAALYAAYHLTCHQWAFRTFFLFGPSAVYSSEQLDTLGIDPFSFVGNTSLGWKMAFCERDLAMYGALLIAGLWFAAHRQARPLSFAAYGLLILPMALDGFSQLLGWRESTWELRVATGLLFGAASGWLLYPRFESMIGAERYAPDPACTPQPSHG